MKFFRILLIACIAALIGTAAAYAHENGAAEQAEQELNMDVPEGTGFEGRVVHEGMVVQGAHVFAYRTFDDLLAFKPYRVSGPTADDGGFEMDMPGGKFYLVAKKLSEDPDDISDGPVPVGGYFSFQGSNPITVAPGIYTHVGFSLIRKDAGPVYEDSTDEGTGTLMGKVLYGGEPLDGVYVSLYFDPSSDFRGMGYSTAPPTGKSGMFRIDFLPDGNYFVIARKRASGSGSGPLTDGDSFGYFLDNPVRVKDGKITKINLEMLSKAGEIGKDDSVFRETGTSISGRITDPDGNVVRGVYAFAYIEKVMAHARPEFISREVGEDGRYVINLSKGGTYYIGSRSAYGDSPGIGEWYGRYDGTPDHSVVVETGKNVDGIDIKVEKILR